MGNSELSDKEQLKFPVSFMLKAIFDNSISPDEHQKNLKSKLLKLGIAYKSISSKLSSNKKYISMSVNVKVEDRDTFDKLYVDLRSIPGIKYAL